MIPITHIIIKSLNNLGFIALLNMIIDGKESVVTAIIKLKTVPSSAPFAKRASATGIVPKISAYIGAPTRVAITTPKILFCPSIFSMKSWGIQLWMIAPIPTPTTT